MLLLAIFLTIACASKDVAGIVDTTVVEPPAGGTGTLRGTVRVNDTLVAGGGVIEVVVANAPAIRIPVTTSGQFTAQVPAGSHVVRLHPPRAYSIARGQPDVRNVTVPLDAAISVDFRVQPAFWYTDFQEYADSLDLHRTFPRSPGAFGEFNTPNRITLDPTGGPGGRKALRYNFPNAPTDCDGQDIFAAPYWGNNGPLVDTLWIRWTSRESPGFSNGYAQGCSAGQSYKFFLVTLGYTSTAAGRLGTYLLDRDTEGHRVYVDMTDRVHFADNDMTQTSDPRYLLGLPSAWTGQWHTWHMQISHIGTNATNFRTYYDGRLIANITAPFTPNVDPRRLIAIQLGANINMGPSQTQQRWFGEVGVYTTRPSLLRIE
jgi:hypothetical protein